MARGLVSKKLKGTCGPGCPWQRVHTAQGRQGLRSSQPAGAPGDGGTTPHPRREPGCSPLVLARTEGPRSPRERWERQDRAEESDPCRVALSGSEWRVGGSAGRWEGELPAPRVRLGPPHPRALPTLSNGPVKAHGPPGSSPCSSRLPSAAVTPRRRDSGRLVRCLNRGAQRGTQDGGLTAIY